MDLKSSCFTLKHVWIEEEREEKQAEIQVTFVTSREHHGQTHTAPGWDSGGWIQEDGSLCWPDLQSSGRSCANHTVSSCPHLCQCKRG